MSNRTASRPRLYALIGDIANDVPEDFAREIESALNEQNLPVQAPTFFACLDAIRKGDGADGQPCHGHRLGAGNHASLSRSLAGLTALLDLLRRPQDQEELGRQLAEALRQILVSTQTIAQDLATLISEQREEIRGLAAKLQEIMAAQRLLIDGQASLNRAVTTLSDDLFEGEGTS